MKKEKIEFRCNSLEKEIIKKKAKNAGLSTSEYCRAAALEQRITYKLTDEELQIYKMLVKYANNFQSISNLLQQKDSRFSAEVLQTSELIKSHLKKLQ